MNWFTVCMFNLDRHVYSILIELFWLNYLCFFYIIYLQFYIIFVIKPLSRLNYHGFLRWFSHCSRIVVIDYEPQTVIIHLLTCISWFIEWNQWIKYCLWNSRLLESLSRLLVFMDALFFSYGWGGGGGGGGLCACPSAKISTRVHDCILIKCNDVSI